MALSTPIPMGRGEENTGCIIIPVLVALFSGTVQLSVPDRTAYVGSADCKDPVGICLGVSCVEQWWCQ